MHIRAISVALAAVEMSDHSIWDIDDVNTEVFCLAMNRSHTCERLYFGVGLFFLSIMEGQVLKSEHNYHEYLINLDHIIIYGIRFEVHVVMFEKGTLTCRLLRANE